MIYDSIIVTGSAQVSGSLSVTSGITGSLQGTSSFALTASYVANASSFPFTGSAAITGSLVVTGSLTTTDIIQTGTYIFGGASGSRLSNNGTLNLQFSTNDNNSHGLSIGRAADNGTAIILRRGAFYATAIGVEGNVGSNDNSGITTFSYYYQANPSSGINDGSFRELMRLNPPGYGNATLDISGSARFEGNTTVSGSLNAISGITGSLQGTSSYALTASYAPDTTFPYTGSAIISGSLNLTGSLSIKDAASNFSIVGNGFGQSSLISPDGAIVLTPGLYGVQINGAFPDLKVNGNITTDGYVASNAAGSYLTGSLFGTSSYALTASFVANASSFPFTGSAIITGSLVVTGSTISTDGFTGSLFGTASFATTASYIQALSTYVTASRTLTINGESYDLTANRSWTIPLSGSVRTIQKFTATSGQTSFTISGGYVIGLVDVYINGVKLDNSGDFTATNGTTVVLTVGAMLNDIVEIYNYRSAFAASNALRVVTPFTATAAQTTFTVDYSPGLVDVFYNGSKLAASEYTASNGTSIILGTAAQLNDIIEVIAYSYSVGAFTGIGGSGTANYVAKFTSGSTIGTSSIYDSGSNVGINTTNPIYRLDVNGSARFTNSAIITGSLSVSGSATTIGATTITGSLNVSGSITSTGTLTAQTLVVQTITSSVLYSSGSNIFGNSLSNTQVMTGSVGITGSLSVNGNVGVGITSPGNKLVISQPVSTLFGNAGTYIGLGDTENSLNQTVLIGFGYRGSSTNEYPAVIGYLATNNGGNQNGALVFGTRAVTTNTAPTERMRIDASGSVGIGTGTSGSSRLNILNIAANPFLELRSTNNAYQIAKITFDEATDKMTIMNNQAYSLSGIAFGTNGTERMFLDVSGNVGIGTTSPSQKLEVVGGEIKAGRVDSSSEGGQVSFGRASDNATGWYIDVYGNTSTPDLRFVDVSNSAVRMSITSAGNVGIGTTSPSTYGNLTVVMPSATNGTGIVIKAINDGGSASQPALTYLNGSGNYIAQIVADNGTGYLAFNTGTSNTERMRITSEGNVSAKSSVTNNTVFEAWNTNTTNGYGAYIRGGQTSSDYALQVVNSSGAEYFRIRGDGAQFLSSFTYGNTVSSGVRNIYIDSAYALGGISSILASKKNIQSFNSDWIHQLTPVQFNYRKKDEEGNYTEEIYDEINYGLIAEDTAPIADFLINYNDTIEGKKMVGIEYMRLITPMLKAIQELKAENDTLKDTLQRNNII